MREMAVVGKDAFNAVFPNLTTVSNCRGEQVKVNSGNRATVENCTQFISQCHQIRRSELQRPLESISRGFWENLGFDCPIFITPDFLESFCCSELVVELEKLKSLTDFQGVSGEDIRIFWRCVEGMTNEQRIKFLQFSTGSTSIPVNQSTVFLHVFGIDVAFDSMLPSAATCFYRLYLPKYSSEGKMYSALITAIENTDSFEYS
jgi:hypothetical protein